MRSTALHTNCTAPTARLNPKKKKRKKRVMIQIPEGTLITTIVLTAFMGGMIGYAVGLWHTKKIMLGNLKAFMEEEKLKPE
jgi:hypothetical protein